MGRWSILFSALLVTWFLLFEQPIETKSINSYEHYEDEEVMDTTEGTIVTNTTDIIGDYHDTLVIEDETPVHPDDKPDSSSDDIINLNVGGQRITTFRSTLTAVPNSKLALMFTKKNNNETKTKRDRVPYFFDYNPVQFEYLLDQLRAIKRLAQKPAYELNFKRPNVDVQFEFSDMLTDLGLNAERFLSPLVGTHLDLKTNSLIGWKMCYRGRYNVPFDATVLTNTCKGERLLVACRSDTDKKTLTVAGVGKRDDLFQSCTPNAHCTTVMQNNTGFYYAQNQAWGFQGRPQNLVATANQYNYHRYGGAGQGSFLLNPCDSSDEYSEYRLCWSLRSNVGRGGGDRCGSSKNLHNTKGWERLIYQTI